MDAVRQFLRARSGATAVEFAIVAPMLLLTIFFVMVVALVLYVNQKLDYATSQAARQVMTGTAKVSGMNQSAFQALVCSRLPSVMPCSNVMVNLYTVPATSGGQSGYYSYVKPDLSGLIIPIPTGGSGQYTLGNAGDYQYLQVVYVFTNVPAAFASMLGSNGFGRFLAIISTAAFRNEKF